MGWWNRLEPLPKVLLILVGTLILVCATPMIMFAALSVNHGVNGSGQANQARDLVAPGPPVARSTPSPVPATTITSQPVTVAPSAAPATTKTSTKPAQPKCDPNYAWACVPIASDVDCAGGSGNGPAYVNGPVKVVGTDIYDLDRDGNGIGCED
jgi:hypothetical protein